MIRYEVPFDEVLQQRPENVEWTFHDKDLKPPTSVAELEELKRSFFPKEDFDPIDRGRVGLVLLDEDRIRVMPAWPPVGSFHRGFSFGVEFVSLYQIVYTSDEPLRA